MVNMKESGRSSFAPVNEMTPGVNDPSPGFGSESDSPVSERVCLKFKGVRSESIAEQKLIPVSPKASANGATIPQKVATPTLSTAQDPLVKVLIEGIDGVNTCVDPEVGFGAHSEVFVEEGSLVISQPSFVPNGQIVAAREAVTTIDAAASPNPDIPQQLPNVCNTQPRYLVNHPILPTALAGANPMRWTHHADGKQVPTGLHPTDQPAPHGKMKPMPPGHDMHQVSALTTLSRAHAINKQHKSTANLSATRQLPRGQAILHGPKRIPRGNDIHAPIEDGSHLQAASDNSIPSDQAPSIGPNLGSSHPNKNLGCSSMHTVPAHTQSQPYGPTLGATQTATRLAQQGPSWASFLQPQAAANIQLKYTKHCRTLERMKLSMPKDLIIEGSKAWANTLVGYFIGRRLPFSLVKNISIRLWDKAGLVDMYATDSGYFFFKFNSKEESDAILEGGPWHFGGQPIILKNWHVGLELTKEAQATIPIWVNIYNVPLEYWNPEGLGYIASAIGRPLHIHRMTASCRRLSFARMCIEVSVEFDLLKDLDIEYEDPVSGELTMITLKMEYQWSPIRCAKCRRFGHNCVPTPISSKAQKSVSRPSSSQSKRKQEEEVWMVVSKGKTVAASDMSSGPNNSGNTDTLTITNLFVEDKLPQGGAESEVRGECP